MSEKPRWLEHAARRSSERLWTLGAAFDQYCHSEDLTREHLSSLLGCSLDSLGWLSLCRKPRPERFAADVSRIAERFQVDASKLAKIVRRVDVLAVLRRAIDTQEQDRLLLAARDRGKESDE